MLSFGLSQFHGHGSWLVCEAALPIHWHALTTSGLVTSPPLSPPVWCEKEREILHLVSSYGILCHCDNFSNNVSYE